MDDNDKLLDALRAFDCVMLGTMADRGSLHARPMAVAEIDPAGVVWFVTSDQSPKADEIRRDQHGVVTAQGGGRYVSVTGRYDIVHDGERIRALWKPAWDAWFDEGPDDASLVLVRFDPEVGETWEDDGAAGSRYVFEAARLRGAGHPIGGEEGAKAH